MSPFEEICHTLATRDESVQWIPMIGLWGPPIRRENGSEYAMMHRLYEEATVTTVLTHYSQENCEILVISYIKLELLQEILSA